MVTTSPASRHPPCLPAALMQSSDETFWWCAPSSIASCLTLRAACARTDLDFTKSHWGEAYPKLLAVKDKYDPHGLFICHHCVGSERWTKESHLNCRAK